MPDEVELEIEAEIEKVIQCVSSEKLGKASRMHDAVGRYVEFCKSTFPTHLSLKGLRLVIDCANGAAYQIAPAIFRELGAEIVVIGNQPNGTNINHQCGATSPDLLAATVITESADVGLALDGDADRIIMVDHTGRVVDGDELLYVLARYKQQNDELHGGVVGTQMSNLGLEIALKELTIPFLRANVGDRYVMEQLLSKDWVLGGESSGHIICRDKVSTGDGIVAALQVLAVMVQQSKQLSVLCAGMQMFPQSLINVRCQNRFDPSSIPELNQLIQDIEQQLTGKGRVLLRASGTEPVIRVMVEGECSETNHIIASQIADAVRAVSSKFQGL